MKMKFQIVHFLSIISFFYVLSTTVIFTVFTNDEEAQPSLQSFEDKFIHNIKLHDFIISNPDTIHPQPTSSNPDKIHPQPTSSEEVPLFPIQYFGSSVINTEFQPSGPLAFQEYIHGTSPYRLSEGILSISDELANERKLSVKAAMKHIWKHYSATEIMGFDEIRPVTNTGKNIDGIARTLVDSLDTLWLMGLKEEFYQGRDYVRDKLTHDSTKRDTSVFETSIRSLGGLLSAYDWSGDEVFLEKAVELGDGLLKAFDTPSGLPYALIQLKTGKCNNGWQGKNTNIAEAGTLIIEFRYLSKVSGNPIYGEKAQLAMNKILDLKPENGLFVPIIQNLKEDVIPITSPSYAKYSFGALNDSFYEYMLKGWLQTGRTEMHLFDSYNAAIEGMYKHLLRKSSKNGFTFISEAQVKNIERPILDMEHLTCFMGGLLGLGVHSMSQLENSHEYKERIERDMQTAKAVTYTCYQMYASTKTGLGSEKVLFVEHKANLRGAQVSSDVFDIQSSAKKYILRPEVVESLYIMHKLTRDPIYREWGWEIFQAIEKNCKTLYGYGSYRDVTKVDSPPQDEMESFFPAETLKYLYLLFDPDSKVDLDSYVFNTEAHPLKMFDKM